MAAALPEMRRKTKQHEMAMARLGGNGGGGGNSCGGGGGAVCSACGARFVQASYYCGYTYLVFTYYSLLTTHYSLLTTYYSLLTTYCSLLTTHYSLLSLLTTHCSLLLLQASGTLQLTTHAALHLLHETMQRRRRDEVRLRPPPSTPPHRPPSTFHLSAPPPSTPRSTPLHTLHTLLTLTLPLPLTQVPIVLQRLRAAEGGGVDSIRDALQTAAVLSAQLPDSRRSGLGLGLGEG